MKASQTRRAGNVHLIITLALFTIGITMYAGYSRWRFLETRNRTEVARSRGG